MSKETETFNALKFVEMALDVEAHKILPSMTTEEQWCRQKNILGIYIGTPATYDEIGEMYGFTNQGKPSRERPRQIIEKAMLKLWRNLPDGLREAYTIHDLKINKPYAK